MFNSDNLRLDGKCAIITGAGAGIGKEIAITFATAGASVVVSDINADAANHVVDEIQQLGGQAFAWRCDITSEQELSALADFAVSKLGKVDILVNNAGGGGPKPFDMPMADFRRAYELNVFSFFHLSQLVAPEMEKNGGGVILTITSMAAENKNINMTSYASSKAAASHLVRNMAFDLGEKNIRVNGIAPGAILTDALKSVITPEIEQKMLQHTPIRRLGQPQDIANAALFLCSPAASWVSGQILTVSAICKSCAISPGTLYHHFISKEALIQAIILQDQERALARFREPIEGIHFVDYMVESIVSLTHEAFGQRALVVEIMAEGMRNPQVAAMLKNKHMTITEFVAQRMRDAQQKGEISPDINTAMTSRLLLDLTYGVLADIEAEDLAREASFAQGLRAMIGGILTAS